MIHWCLSPNDHLAVQVVDHKEVVGRLSYAVRLPRSSKRVGQHCRAGIQVVLRNITALIHTHPLGAHATRMGASNHHRS